MTGVQHPAVAAGRWSQLWLAEQPANVGGEVERALTWLGKKNPEYSLFRRLRLCRIIEEAQGRMISVMKRWKC